VEGVGGGPGVCVRMLLPGTGTGPGGCGSCREGFLSGCAAVPGDVDADVCSSVVGNEVPEVSEEGVCGGNADAGVVELGVVGVGDAVGDVMDRGGVDRGRGMSGETGGRSGSSFDRLAEFVEKEEDGRGLGVYVRLFRTSVMMDTLDGPEDPEEAEPNARERTLAELYCAGIGGTGGTSGSA
jgi:hypothetical protein